MASRSSLIIMSSFLVILVLLSSMSSCSGRFLTDQSIRDHVNYSTYTVDDHHHDHGNLKLYLINSMARLFRFERSLIQEDAGQTIFNVDDFGAEGNGANDDKQAFEKAWEKACSSTGRTVLVVLQKTYLATPVKFQGPCKSNNLTVQIRGTIEASDDRSNYIDKHWLLFENIQNLSVEGGGTLDGKGQVWWDHSCKFHNYHPCITSAPTALTFRKCDNLIVRDLKVRNSPQMQVAFEKCKKVRVSQLTVTAPGNAPNTDGIHITHTQDIEVSNSDIGTGDDCISIVSGTQNVRAMDITCGPGHGISIGSLGGGNSEAHVSDVIVDRAKFSGTSNGVRIKTWQGGSGSANNMKFLNIEMNNVYNPIIIDQNYCIEKKSCKEQNSAVQVRDILYRNISGTSATKVAVKFDCSRTFKCENIVLEDVDIRQHHGKDKVEASCKNVELTDFGVVSPPCSHAREGRKNDTTAPPVREPGQGKNDTKPLPPLQKPGQGKNDTRPVPPQPPVQQPGQGTNDTAPMPPLIQQPGQGKNDTTAPPPVQQPGHASKPPVQQRRHHDYHRSHHHHHHHRRHHNNHRGEDPTKPPLVQQPGHGNDHKERSPIRQSVFSVDDFGAKGNGKDDTDVYKTN